LAVLLHPGGTVLGATTMHGFRTLLFATLALIPFGLTPAAANPLGSQVVGGNATVQGQGTAAVTVTQQTNSAIINWNTFNIGVGEKSKIVMPSSSSVELDRVTGGLGPSQILGSLGSNGRVFLVNRDGILFGPGAAVDTAGFLATTHDIANADFMAGRYNFSIPGNPSASVVNQGTITAQSGGFAALVAPGVRNSGTITAKLGTIALASGNAFTLDFYGDKLITLGVNDSVAAQVKDVSTGQPLSSLVSNEGKLKANGGTVELTAVAARQVVDSVINNTGVIEANSIGTHNGMIVLAAATAASKPAGAPTQTVKVSGKLSAAGKKQGTKGGTIEVTGEAIVLSGATIDASGSVGGGTVLIGGDVGGGNPNPAVASIPQAQLQPYAVPTASTVTVDAATTINASATGAGDGGKVVVWSDGATTFNGSIMATGGTLAGNGGFVETSGHVLNFADARVDTSAPNGWTGSWLLDPFDLTIDSAAAATIATDLATTSVTIQTTASGSSGPGISNPAGNGDIFVNSGISWGSANSLTLSAYRNIAVNANITNTDGAAVALRADNTGAGVGTVSFGGGVLVSTAGAVSIFYNPSVNPAGSVVNTTSYVNPTENFTGHETGGGTRTAYMLVNTVYDLQNIQNNLSGIYAFGKDIDASATANWNSGAGFVPIGVQGQFTGQLNGQGSTINNLFIAPTANNIQEIGLFSQIGAGGVVRNLNLTNVNIRANPNLGTNSGTGFQEVGALAGTNAGLIDHVTASGTINGGTVSAGGAVGGLVGRNGDFSDNNSTVYPGTIQNSSAAVNVSSAGVNVELGGLVGQNIPSAMITSSYATGNVTATATIASNNGTNCSTSGSNCQNASAGGLVGQNSGTIQGAAVPSLTQACVAGQTCATGAVSVGSDGVGGGLVGQNDGLIFNAFATGTVTGAASLLNAQTNNGNTTQLGGLAGNNQGLITDSHATGNVGTLNVANLSIGGLVAENSGAIKNSYATGNVRAGDNSNAGGLTGDNSTGFNSCSGCSPGDGSAYFSAGLISNSYATGNVTVGAASVAGGLSGSDNGTINNTYATGAVSGGGNSILGGLIGVADHITATITNSTASGAVSSTGPNSWVGGFIGVNGGAISLSSASGPVIGTSESLLGGFVGINFGVISDAMTAQSATVTGTGANNFVGGFVGVNFGSIDPSTAAGAVTGGANNVVGGFAGANASLAGYPAGLIPGSTFPIGTVSAGSLATGVATGGPNSIVGAQVGTTNPTALPASPSIVTSCSGGGLCSILQSGLTLASPTPLSITPTTQITQLILPIDNNVTIPDPIFASLTPPSSPAGSSLSGTVSYPNATPGKPGFIPPPLPRRAVPGPNGETRSSVPPPGENRFFKNQVLLQLDLNIPDAELTRIAQQLGLRIITSDTMTTLGRKVIRFELPPGLSVRDAILRLESNRLVSVAAPIYQFLLVQAAAAISKGDSAQYMLGKLHLDKAQVIATGKGVTIALIDSEIDQRHTELQGAISEELDTLDVKEPPDSHGTAMAGAIVSHDRLLGVAPGATILAVRAFGKSNNTAEGTTLSILKGIDWAVSQGARVINMSFAGPRDPSLERALKAAHEKGVVLIAAAGNAGPKSPPLYPGADPNVIAVTATDVRDQVFRGANQGPQLSVAAPGVEILAAAPEETYQMSTGTSIATAHVSGVVALMLERDPTLKPDDVRKILESTTTDLGPKGKNSQFGWGLVNPEKALEAVAARLKSSDGSSKNR
jgi:filamentous hemagglutinin family protein